MTLLAAFGALFLILWAVFYAALPLIRRSGAVGARLLARASVRWARVGRFTNWFRAYAPIALVVIVGAFIIGWAADEFLDLAELLHVHSPKLQDFDVLMHSWAVSRRDASATTFFLILTTVGSPVGLTVIVVCISVGLALMHRYRWMLYLMLTAGGGALLDFELKRFFVRARPDIAEMLRRAHGYSFPSGHAMGSTVVFLALSYLAFRSVSRWSWKAAWLALAWTLILAISLSRVYLGVHWISDVAAGIAAGTLWVALTTLAYETIRRIRMLRTKRSGDS